MESEDEDGEELTPGVDAAILRMLAKIKRRDPEIYDKEREIFEGGSFCFSESKASQSIGQRSKENPVNWHRLGTKHERTKLYDFHPHPVAFQC